MAKSKKEQETDFHSLDVEAKKANIEAQKQEMFRRNIEVCIAATKIKNLATAKGCVDVPKEATIKISELIKKLKS